MPGRPRPSAGRARRIRTLGAGVLCLALALGGATVTARSASAAVPLAGVVAGDKKPGASPSPRPGSSGDDTLDEGAGDDGSTPGKPKGNVTFGLRPSGQTKVDLRQSWTYQDLTPGQVVNDYLARGEPGNQPTTFSVYAADAKNTTSGGYSVLPSSRSSLDIGSWITVARSQVTVPARSSVIMPFRLVVPRNVEPGDHAGGIVASFRTSAKNAQGNVVTVDSRVGSRVYARVKGTLHPRLTVERLDTVFEPGGGLGKGSAIVTFTVRNAGNVRLAGHQTVRVADLFGSSASATQVPDLPELLPQNSFTYSVRVAGLMPVSYFTAEVTVDPQSVAGNLDPALAQAIAAANFLGLSYQFLALLLLVLAAVAWIGWRWWRAAHPRKSTPKGKGSPPAKAPGLVTKQKVPASADAGSGAGTQPMQSNRTEEQMFPKARARRRGLRIAGTLVAGVLVSLGGATLPAQAAAGDGTLTFLPAKGLDIDPMYAVLSGPCPAGATHTVGILTGKGFPADGINVVPATPAGMRHDEAFGVPLQNALKNFAAMNGVTFSGDYTLTVRCVDRLATKTFATFTGVISFADPTHFTAKAPTTPPGYGVPMGVLAQTFPSLAAAPPAQQPDAGPAAQSPAPAGQQPAAAGASGAAAAAQAQGVAPAVAAGSPAAAPAAPDSGTSSSTVFSVLGVIAVVGGICLLVARRRAEAGTQVAPPAKTRWPDEERV